MTAPVRIKVRQRTPEWREARRRLITGTAIPVLLGLSPYRCEADLADEMLGRGVPDAENVRMRLGTALEPLIQQLYEERTGRTLRRQHGLIVHPDIPWAGASLDCRAVGESLVVETKYTASRTRFADGLPEEIEAQAVWQAAVAGVEAVDVAALVLDELRVYTVPANPELFANLVVIAEDFRRRLAAGGPFSRDAARIRRDHPSDDGSTAVAPADVADAMRALLDLRAQIKRHEETEERLVAQIEAWMGDAAVLEAPGMRATWKRTKDRSETDWKAIAADLMAPMGETDRDAVVARFTSVRPGMRPFRLVGTKEE